MSKKYLFIDTNIYVFCATLSKDEHNNELIEQITSALGKNKDLVLIVPEIVQLEYERVSKDDLERREAIINELGNKIVKDNKGLSDVVSKLIQDITKNMKANHKKVSESLEKIFKSQSVCVIEVTPQIFTNAYKRAVVGKKPFSIRDKEKGELHNPINADCVIFETIRDFFTNQKIQKEDKLLFCTDNALDFSDGNGNLAPDLVADLPIQTSFYDNFPKLIKDEFKKVVSEETIEKYQNLTESVATIARQALGQINTSAAKLALDKLSTLSFNNTVLHQDAFTKFQDLTKSASILSAQALGQINASTALSQLVLDHASASSVFTTSKQTCSICGSTFERSIFDSGSLILQPDRCPKCRENFLTVSPNL